MKAFIPGLLAAFLAGCSPSSVASPLKPMNAAEIVAQFKAKGLPVGPVTVATEASDTNHLLGRPRQYTSKASFPDTRHLDGPDVLGPSENTVEVFENTADALARQKYIEGVTKGVAFLAQYQVRKGSVLARFDRVLTPKEVAQYDAALTVILQTRP